MRERIRKSEWLFVEGYVFANPETGQGAMREAIRQAKAARHEGRAHLLGGVRRRGVRRRFPCRTGPDRSAVLQRHRGDGRHRAADAAEAFAKLCEVVPAAVVTDGPNGAFVRYGGARRMCRPSRASRRT